MKLTNAKDMIKKARSGKYAIAHINTNNYEWTKAILTAAQETKTPVIIGVSEGAAKYMSGYKVVASMVSSMMEALKVTVPVALHLDHGSYDGALAAANAGFSSIMFDGSHYTFEENIQKTKEMVDLCKKMNLSLEVELGTIGGEEDGVIGAGDVADVEECRKMSSLGVDMLAAGIGNIHGAYPDNWPGLRFDVLEQISKAVNNLPLVLHGGSGIPDAQIKKAISLGVSKINVNSELQWAFADATVKYCKEGKAEGKGKDPRKLLAPGYEAMKKVIVEKFTLFGSLGKAV